MEDASFCHRCGKAQREFLPQAAEEEPTPEVASRAEAPPAHQASVQPVSFANGVAVRVGFLAASVASMLDALPWVDALFLVWSGLAGYFSVIMYRRRTGQALTIRGGAKMGWITGVMNAVIVIVFFTLTVVASMSELPAAYRQQLAALQTKDPARYAVASGILENPYTMAAVFLVLMFLIFAMATIAGVAGGALSAKFAKKEQ